ncbi:MAG TPA: 16S rRNA processing protein RimM [Anaerolineaceae bacterium]|nr:16S rRNA processing protein RimM [Anaerolineaceae bacterium]
MSGRPSAEDDHPVMKSGSPQSGEPFYNAIGKIRRTHGVHGELLMELLTDFPERFKTGIEVWIGDNHTPYTVSSFRLTGNGALIAFQGFDDCDKAVIFRNQMVYGKSEDAPRLPEGEYYQHEILGMRVVDEAGNNLGTVSEILTTGANDVYVVVNEEGSEMLLPAIKQVILSIDQSAKVITARPLEWD